MKLSEIDILKIGHSIQLVGAVYAGEGRALLAVFPEDRDTVPADLELLDMDLDDWQVFLRQTDLLETEVTARAADGTLKKAILRKGARQIEQGISWRVFKRDGYACRYCGKDDLPLTVDHLVCWEEGGPSIEANLLSSCRRDNKIRGNLSYDEWLQHPHYLKVSRGLTPEVRAANEAIIATLAGIPRLDHIKRR